MTIQTIDTVTPTVGLKPAANIINSNFTNAAHAASYEVGTAADEIPRNSDLALSGANFGKNLIINGDFSVNQRDVSGTVSLSAGEYGHDRFKGGTSGCTYTLNTSAGVTTITITAGSLIQIIEGQTLKSKPVVLGWDGTAQGRINSGTYGGSGSVTETLTGGANATVEFNAGTLSNVQLEFGGTSTEFEYVSPADQLARCKRYFELLQRYHTNGANTSTTFGVEKRGTPSISGSTSASITVHGFYIPAADASGTKSLLIDAEL